MCVSEYLCAWEGMAMWANFKDLTADFRRKLTETSIAYALGTQFLMRACVSVHVYACEGYLGNFNDLTLRLSSQADTAAHCERTWYVLHAAHACARVAY